MCVDRDWNIYIVSPSLSFYYCSHISFTFLYINLVWFLMSGGRRWLSYSSLFPPTPSTVLLPSCPSNISPASNHHQSPLSVKPTHVNEASRRIHLIIACLGRIAGIGGKRNERCSVLSLLRQTLLKFQMVKCIRGRIILLILVYQIR